MGHIETTTGEKAFVRARTRVAAVPFVPELQLHIAVDDAYTLWAEAAAVDDDLPFWAFPWAGGQALARHLLDNPDLVRGKVVLDLASGSGLVAIAAARAGAARVHAIDRNPHAVAAALLNAELNGVDGVTAAVTDAADIAPMTGDGPAGTRTDGGAFDLVLAGDVFYDRSTADRFRPLLRRWAVAGAMVLAGDPDRPYPPGPGWAAVARYDVVVLPGLEDTDVRATTIWQPVVRQPAPGPSTQD